MVLEVETETPLNNKKLTQIIERIQKMAQSELIKNIVTLVSANLLSEADLADAVNLKLAPMGVSLSGSAAKVTRRAKGAAQSAPASPRTEYEDGRSNNHAILLAVSNLGEEGGQSADIQAELEKIGHPMESAVFNTTKSNLKNKYKFLKSKGGKREQVITLTAAGKKALEEFEAPEEEEVEEEAE